MLAQCTEKGGSARGVRSGALRSICDRGEDLYEVFVLLLPPSPPTLPQLISCAASTSPVPLSPPLPPLLRFHRKSNTQSYTQAQSQAQPQTQRVKQALQQLVVSGDLESGFVGGRMVEGHLYGTWSRGKSGGIVGEESTRLEWVEGMR